MHQRRQAGRRKRSKERSHDRRARRRKDKAQKLARLAKSTGYVIVEGQAVDPKVLAAARAPYGEDRHGEDTKGMGEAPGPMAVVEAHATALLEDVRTDPQRDPAGGRHRLRVDEAPRLRPGLREGGRAARHRGGA